MLIFARISIACLLNKETILYVLSKLKKENNLFCACKGLSNYLQVLTTFFITVQYYSTAKIIFGDLMSDGQGLLHYFYTRE